MTKWKNIPFSPVEGVVLTMTYGAKGREKMCRQKFLVLIKQI